jgi:membrane fusion protein (multidrug efflux system)
MPGGGGGVASRGVPLSQSLPLFGHSLKPGQAHAALVFAQQQAKRYQELAATAIAGTVQDAQRYTSGLRQQQAAVESARATLALAQRQIEALKAQRSSAAANLGLRKAQRDQAQLDLSHTIVTADQPGRVVQLSAAVGEFAQTGTNLTMFVPDDIWVWANFKESQLDYMRPGQRVTRCSPSSCPLAPSARADGARRDSKVSWL